MAVRHLVKSTVDLPGLVRNHHLITMMVRRDLSQRYRGALIGAAWSLLQPLFMLVLYTFVFSIVLKVKLGPDASTKVFAVYLFCGLLPWLAFSEGITRCCTVMVENTNLVRKVVFPLEILPLKVVLAAIVNQGIGSLVFIPVALLLGTRPMWTWLLVPLLLIPQTLWTMGLGWLLASIGVYIRDLGQLIGLVLTAWVFMTPIYYPESSIPARLHFIVVLNPMAVLVDSYRAMLLQGKVGELVPLAATTAVGAVAFVLGYAWFAKTKKGFADVL